MTPFTKRIQLLSGGAAQGLVGQLRERFLAESGCAVEGAFGAVGAMRDKLLGGAACDMVILTQALVDQLTKDGALVTGSAVPLGVVKTGVAVKAGEPQPQVSTAETLKAALRAAHGVYFPDPQLATAGIHFMKVMKSLGVADELAPRLHPYPNGATAMRAMAQSSATGLVGCTQVTEILYTPGVTLVGLLPREFELATVYTAAVCARASEPDAARAFIALLAGAKAEPLRRAGGFEAA